MGPLGITTLDVGYDDDGQIEVLSDPVTIVQGGKILFQIPQEMYLRVTELNEKLTGLKYLSPILFVRMINTGIWWEHRRNPGGDMGAVGFAIRAAALDETQSYEEGVKAAREKAQNVRNLIG
jgi:hypothetical protein